MNTTSIYVFTFECKLIYSYMTYGFPIRCFSFQLSKFLVIARFPTNFNFLSFKKKKRTISLPLLPKFSVIMYRRVCIHRIGSLDAYNGIWLAHYFLFQILNISFPLTNLFVIHRFPIRIKKKKIQRLVIFG